MRRFSLTPGRLLILIALFILAWLAAMVAYVPASWVWTQVKPGIEFPPSVSVEAVGGTIWSGAALARFDGHALRLSWDLDMPESLGQWPLGWTLETERSRLQGEIRFSGTDRLEVLINNGTIALADFAALSRQFGLTLPGTITIENLAISLADGRIMQARGVGRWDGGNISWSVGGQSGSARLPPLVAHLGGRAGNLTLDIVTAEAAEELVNLTVSPEGMATLEVRRRLPQLSGMNVGEGAADDIVFRVQHRLFQ